MAEKDSLDKGPGSSSSSVTVATAAIIASVIAGVFSIIVAFISLHSVGKIAVDAAITARQLEIAEMVEKQNQLKSGFILGEIRAFAFDGNHNDKSVSDLRKLGWLECAGQDLLVRDYPSLYTVIGEKWGSATLGVTFNAPDLRGLFLRGWDHSAGKDDGPNRAALKPGGNSKAVGSYQETHVQGHGNHVTSPAMGDIKMAASRWQTNQSGGGSGAWSMESTSGAIANETAPRNAYVMYCIYVGRPVLDTTP